MGESVLSGGNSSANALRQGDVWLKDQPGDCVARVERTGAVAGDEVRGEGRAGLGALFIKLRSLVLF